MAADLDFVKKSGAWYAYNDEKIGQGRENAKAYLADHPEVVADLNQKFALTTALGSCSCRSGRRRTNKFIRLIIRKNRALQFGSFLCKIY